MELSAKLLHDVEFKERWRGYDPDEVDAFLEQVARGVEALQDRLRDAERTEKAGRNGRVERVEVRDATREVAREPRDLGTEDELRRVLVLAQRTADTAVREAREEAERLVAEASAHSEQVTTTADAYGTRVRREADEDVARRVQAAQDEVAQAGADALQRLNDEVARLEAERDDLQRVVAMAEGYLGEHRARAALAVQQLQRLIDDPASLGAVPMATLAPEVATVAAVVVEEGPGADVEGDELAWDETDDELEDVDDELDEVEGDEEDELVEDTDDELDDLDGSDEDGDELDEAARLEGAADEAGVGEPAAASGGPGLIDLAETPSLLDDAQTGELFLGLDDVPSVAWGDGPRAAMADDGGPATQAMAPMPDDVEIDEDAYLAELRQAIAADEELSPAAEAFFNQAAYEDDRWKGLRRRR